MPVGPQWCRMRRSRKRDYLIALGCFYADNGMSLRAHLEWVDGRFYAVAYDWEKATTVARVPVPHPDDWGGGRGYFEEVMMAFINRQARTQERVEVQWGEEAIEWAAKYLALFEYLTVEAWEDGSVRVTSTLTVFCEHGLFKGCINDRDGSRTLWATAGSFQGLLDALEVKLKDPTAEWRPYDRNTTPRKVSKGGGK